MKKIKTLPSVINDHWDIIAQFDGQEHAHTDVMILAKSKTRQHFVAWSGTINANGHLDVFSGHYSNDFVETLNDFHRRCLVLSKFCEEYNVAKEVKA